MLVAWLSAQQGFEKRKGTIMQAKAMIVTMVAVVLACLGGRLSAAVSFTPLGDLPGGSFESSAYGVSADGSIVVGNGQFRP